MMMDFDALFRKATGLGPFPYQVRMAAGGPGMPSLVSVPTGLGKTAGAVLGWLWRRRFASEECRETTPRRLVYCLPMRVLVEQVRDEVVTWLHCLELLAGEVELDEKGMVRGYRPTFGQNGRIAVVTLMGGVDAGRWDIHPEQELVLIGTQDMLLSRALNRGFAMSRFRWPLQFGVLNNDAQWIVDELQLMGSGLATTAQLQALRRKLGTVHPVVTLWMSATLGKDWLNTVDVELAEDLEGQVELDAKDHRNKLVRKRVGARKNLSRSNARVGNMEDLVQEVLDAHLAGKRTLVIVNTVDRAQALFRAINRDRCQARVVLVHSRFRPHDRQRAMNELLATPGSGGTIAVTTQVVEAGVNVSSATLFTEVAPWPSLVQRFGRCNRFGEYEESRVIWIALPEEEKARLKFAPPYEVDDLRASEDRLAHCTEVGPNGLPVFEYKAPAGAVVRRRDVVELFDTTTDLMGFDTDVSRFIRDTQDHDVKVFWRELPEKGPRIEEPEPLREDLCSVPIGQLQKWLEGRRRRDAWQRDPVGGEWVRHGSSGTPRLHPGMILLLRGGDGGYTPEAGWDQQSKKAVPVLSTAPESQEDMGHGADPLSERRNWLSLQEHTQDVVEEVQRLLHALGLGEDLAEVMLEGARLHDAGKAHPLFQEAIRGDREGDAPLGLLAKSALERIRYRRRGFRHELASALLALQNGRSDLVAYLVAAHHGKVRMSIRSLPEEDRPEDPECRFARGIWQGDKIDKVDLGGGVVISATELDLKYMDLGEHADTGESWLARTTRLRDDPQLGPFRLAYMEALLKAADEQASARTKERDQ